MSEQYTPDTDEIREQFLWEFTGEKEGKAAAAFDRWLAAHDAEVAAAAWDEGHNARRSRGRSKCNCGAWSDGECACGLYGTGELLSMKDNPYRGDLP
jgi:hypothetical protein